MLRILLITAVVLMVPLGLTADSESLLSKDAPYSDNMTCLVFPAKIGSFTKYMVRKNENRHIGVTISYGTHHPGCLADIFIYDLKSDEEEITPEEFRKHVDQVCRNINIKSPKQVESKEQSENYTLIGRQFCKNNGVTVAELYLYSIEINGDNFRSDMLILYRGSQIIKVRATVPAELPDGIAQSMQFFKELCKVIFENRKIDFVPSAVSGKSTLDTTTRRFAP